MIRPTPLLQIPYHSRSRSLVQRQVIASDAIDLAPACAASGLQREIYVGESLTDLGVEVLRYPSGWGGQVGRGVPAACRREM